MGPYRILETLGQGGMGTVYAAEHRERAGRIALKMMRAEPGRANEQRFRREAEATARLSHPNLVAIDDFGECEDGWYIAMELVQGVTLRAWLEAPRDAEAIVAVITQAAQGLAHAHARGLVHRDVKPDNLMVDADGRARLTDFGLAKAVEGSAVDGCSGFDVRLTATGDSPGTVGYMAPEQLLAREITPATDQFALAATAFEALHGQSAFAGATGDLVALAILEGNVRPVPPGSTLSAEARAALARALAVDPAARFDSIVEFASALGSGPSAAPARRSWRNRVFGRR